MHPDDPADHGSDGAGAKRTPGVALGAEERETVPGTVSLPDSWPSALKTRPDVLTHNP